MVHGIKCCVLSGCCLLSISLQAVTMKDLFFSMPTELLPTLNESARRDLVDFFTNKQTATIPTALTNKCVLSAFTDGYLRLETSSVSTIQVKKLPVADGSVILLINTVFGPLPDSRVRLFTENWKPVNGFSLPELKPRNFLDNTRVDEHLKNRFDQLCNRFFIQMDADPSAPVIHIRATFSDDVPENLMAPFKGLYTDSLTLTWDGRSFRF